MTGDYARWLATEAAMVLTFDRPEPPEDGEQCIRCLRYTYDPHCGQCMNCGFQMHPEED